MWNRIILRNMYIQMPTDTVPAFFWKHEISTVPGRLKIEKFMIFFEFLVLSSYCFLSVKSCVEQVFAGFRAIRCRKHTFFDDLEFKKTAFLWKNLHFVVCNSVTSDRIEFAKDVKYSYFIEYLHFNAQQHFCCGFLFENMQFSLYPEV